MEIKHPKFREGQRVGYFRIIEILKYEKWSHGWDWTYLVTSGSSPVWHETSETEIIRQKGN
jgi:hypothetical protein